MRPDSKPGALIGFTGGANDATAVAAELATDPPDSPADPRARPGRNLEDQDRRRRGLRPAQVPTCCRRLRKWVGQPATSPVFRSDRANVVEHPIEPRRSACSSRAICLSSFPAAHLRSVTHYVHHSTSAWSPQHLEKREGQQNGGGIMSILTGP